MSKKTLIIIVIAGLVAVVAGAWFTTGVFAKEGGFGDRLRIARRGLGQVISIDEEQFTVQRRDGETYTIMVDVQTNFRGEDREELSFDDLDVEDWVIVVPARMEAKEDNRILARAVFILPEEFDPLQFRGARGLIASVDVVARQFSLNTGQGEQLTFDVDDETRFRGEIESLSDLEPDMSAIVASQAAEDGSLLALGVRSPAFGRKPLQKRLGQVLEVDLDGSAFTLQPRGSEEPLTFQVGENTRFRGREQSVLSLEDLNPGMIVAVGAHQGDDGTLQAVVVFAVERDQLPDFEDRIAGRVIEIDNNSFTIHTRYGKSYSILVIGDTVFRGRSGQVQSLEDLQVDMLVLVGGKELGNGQHQYQAQLVLVLPKRR